MNTPKIVGKTGYEYVATYEEVFNSGVVAAIKFFEQEFSRWIPECSTGELGVTLDEIIEQARKDLLKPEN